MSSLFVFPFALAVGGADRETVAYAQRQSVTASTGYAKRQATAARVAAAVS